MEALLAYEALGLRDFFTAVFGFASDLASAFALPSPAAFFAAGWGRAALGLAGAASEVPPSGTAAGAATGSGFSSGALALAATFFTFLAENASSAAGAGAAIGWSPLAITSPLYTQHLIPITP